MSVRVAPLADGARSKVTVVGDWDRPAADGNERHQPGHVGPGAASRERARGRVEQERTLRELATSVNHDQWPIKREIAAKAEREQRRRQR